MARARQALMSGADPPACWRVMIGASSTDLVSNVKRPRAWSDLAGDSEARRPAHAWFEAFREARDGDSNHAEHDAAFDLAEAARALAAHVASGRWQ